VCETESKGSVQIYLFGSKDIKKVFFCFFSFFLVLRLFSFFFNCVRNIQQADIQWEERLLVKVQLALFLGLGARLGHRVVNVRLGGLGEDTRPVTLAAVRKTVVGMTGLEVDPVALAVEHDRLELARGRRGGRRSRRSSRGRRSSQRLGGRRLTLRSSLLRLRSGYTLDGGHLGSRGLDLLRRGSQRLIVKQALRHGLLGGLPRLHLGDALSALSLRQVGPRVLARLLGRRGVAVGGLGVSLLRSARDDRALGGLAPGLVLDPVLAELGLCLRDLWLRPGRAAGEDALSVPRVKVCVLLLQRRAELDALGTQGRAREAIVLQNGADAVGEETPDGGLALGRRGVLRLLLLLGLACASRRGLVRLQGRDTVHQSCVLGAHGRVLGAHVLHLGQNGEKNGVIGGRHFGGW
jgi:hypothetical protein